MPGSTLCPTNGTEKLGGPGDTTSGLISHKKRKIRGPSGYKVLIVSSLIRDTPEVERCVSIPALGMAHGPH